MATTKKNTPAEELAELKEMVLSQAAVIKQLQAQNAPKPKAKTEPLQTPKETFKVDGTAYKFTVPKYIDANGNPMLAKAAMENPAELERLVKIKSGILQKV